MVIHARESGEKSVNHRISRMADNPWRFNEHRSCALLPPVLLALMIGLFSYPRAQTAEANKPVEWKSVSFAIVRFNDEAPASWNIYHTSKRGVLLVKLWKRYLLVNIPEQRVFDIDPRTVKPQGDGVQWSTSDMPEEPLEITNGKIAMSARFNESASASVRTDISWNCSSRCVPTANQPIKLLTTHVLKQSYAKTNFENTPMQAFSNALSTKRQNNLQGV